ncbi:MAG TPA: deoxyribose-phosphate aldolase [Coleofasciculaceae cyanobacterium]|jgi:deoxyribose-phosphate aldolase
MQDVAVSTNVRLARAIDHTKLTFAPGEDEAQAIARLCSEAREMGFYAVCVRPRHVGLCHELLAGSPVKIAAVIGFPSQKVQLEAEWRQPTIGGFSTAEKLAEIAASLQAGADELDLVVNVADLKQDAQDGGCRVPDELQAVRQAAGEHPVKAIIETDLLTTSEITQATSACAQADLAMVKTSTGMIGGGKGATLENIGLIAETLRALNSPLGIKASGGVQTREQAVAFLDAGACRIGTSSGIAIMQNMPLHDGAGY